MEGIHELSESEVMPAAAMLVRAFAADPVWQRVFEAEPGLERRAAAFETPVRFGRHYGAVWATSSRLEGIAVWLPGERADMTLWRMLRSGALNAGLRLGPELARRLELVFRPLQRDRHEHMQGRRYRYLLVLGVAPEFQGQGFGGRLLRALVAGGSQHGVHLYLETETEANVRMYEHFGFRVLREVILPAIALPMWQMAREPGIPE